MRREAALDVRLRLLVLHVEAGDQALHRLAGDHPRSPSDCREIENSRAAAGRKTAKSATSSSPAAFRHRLGHRHALRAARCAARPARARVALDVTSTGKATRSRPLRRRRPRPPPACTRSAFDSASSRGSAASRGSCSASSRSITSKLRSGLRAVERRQVQHVHEQPRALDVREEVVAEPGAGRGALDQPRDVGQHELAVLGVDRPEHRLQRRERIRGDLRLRPRHPGQQRRLAGVRQPDEPDVGQQLQLQLDLALLARQPLLGQPRRLPHRGGEVLVPAPARAAAGDRDLLARPHEVVAAAVPALDGRARRDAHDQRSPSAPWRSAPSPCPPRSAR